MQTKMIKQWAAAVTLACITTTLNAQTLVSSLVTSSSGSYKSTSLASIALAANSFTGGNNQDRLYNLELGQQLVLSFDISYGSSDSQESLNAWPNFVSNAGLSFGFTSNNNSEYAAIKLDSTGSEMAVLKRGSNGMGYTGYGTVLESKTLAAAEAPHGAGNSYHYTFSIERTDGTLGSSGGKYTLTFSDGVNTVQAVDQTLADGDLLNNVGLRVLPNYITNSNDSAKYSIYYKNLTVGIYTVPEPSTWALLGSSVALLAFLRRRK